MIQRVQVTIRFCWALLLDVTRKDIASLAAVVCFYGLFSMFPLLLLILYSLSFLAPNDLVEHALVQSVRPFFPALPDAKKFIADNITRLAGLGAKVTLFSLFSLLWSATSAFIALQQALDVIFEVKIPRSYFSRRMVGFAMFALLLLVMMVTSIALAMFPATFSHSAFWRISIFHHLPYLSITNFLFPFVLFVTCVLLYRMLPTHNAPLRPLLIGAFVATVLLDIARQMFVWYAESFVRYEMVYGTLAILMIIVLWMYVASTLALFGAAVSHQWMVQFES